ncbi:ASTRA-associated protein [Trichinella pseudospiralis]
MRSLLHDLSEDILSSRSFESPPPLIGSGCPRIAIFVDSFLTLISLFWLFLIGRCEELEEQFDGRRATSNDCPLAACVVLDNQLLHRPRKVTPATRIELSRLVLTLLIAYTWQLMETVLMKILLPERSSYAKDTNLYGTKTMPKNLVNNNLKNMELLMSLNSNY